MPIRLPDDLEQRRPKRYKHTLRKSPYFISLLFLLAATALTLLNIYVADLIHVIVRQPGPLQFETKYGLYQRCTRKTPVPNAAFFMPSHPLPQPSSIPTYGVVEEVKEKWPILDPIDNEGDGWICEEFPTRTECAQFGEGFCILWSTAGYAAQLSLVPCLASLFSLMFIFLYRGKRSSRARARRQQWKLVSGTMLIHCLLQITSFAIILHVFWTDARFEAKGSHLDRSFHFGIASAVVSGAMTVLLTFTGLAARAGRPWAAGKSAQKAQRHRRTRSGRVVPVPEGTPIPAEQRITIGEVEAAKVVESPTERTGLLDGSEGLVGGGADHRATD